MIMTKELTDYEEGWAFSKIFIYKGIKIYLIKRFIKKLETLEYIERTNSDYAKGRVDCYKNYLIKRLLKGEIS